MCSDRVAKFLRTSDLCVVSQPACVVAAQEVQGHTASHAAGASEPPVQRQNGAVQPRTSAVQPVFIRVRSLTGWLRFEGLLICKWLASRLLW
jgi:hypothetical protein